MFTALIIWLISAAINKESARISVLDKVFVEVIMEYVLVLKDILEKIAVKLFEIYINFTNF